MLADSHMHTSFSSDSEAPMEQMVKQAIYLGMDSICFTDHYDKDYGTDEFQLDTEAYLSNLTAMQEKYVGQIEIRFGVELGLQIHLQAWLKRYVNQYPFDFVIGSMHLLNGKDPYYRENFAGKDEKELLRQYFQATAANIDSFHDFQSLGHLDYLARYLGQEAGEYTYREYAEEIDEVLKKLILYGIALEVNSGGYRSVRSCPNPGEDVLKRYRELGGELITIGADGHTPKQIGYEFSRVQEVLQDCGYRFYTVYKQKKAIYLKI